MPVGAYSGQLIQYRISAVTDLIKASSASDQINLSLNKWNVNLLFFFLLLRNNATTVKISATAKATAMMTIIASAALSPGLIEPPPVSIKLEYQLYRGLARSLQLRRICSIMLSTTVTMFVCP